MKQVIAFVLAIVMLSGCERLYLSPNKAGDPFELVDELWTTVHQHYPYFEFKGIDWLAAREAIEPRLSADMSEDSLFAVMSDLLYVLEDGHVNLEAGFNYTRNWNWYLDYPANYNAEFVLRHYLGNDFIATGPFRYVILDGNIGYLQYRSFGSDISTTHLNIALDYLQDTKGLILDIRGNGGGDTDNIKQLMERFIREKTEVGYLSFKNGPAPEDFTDPVTVTFEPFDGQQYLKPIALLTNRACYSAATIFAGFMGELDRVTLIGDQTGGGGGYPVSYELSNGWRFRYTASRFTLLDGFELEGGVPVDMPVGTGAVDELQGEDAIIEAAIDLLQ
jgi:hypothetical protein